MSLTVENQSLLVETVSVMTIAMTMTMTMYDAGFFDIDHTKPSTVDSSTRSRSAERDKVPPATTASPARPDDTTRPTIQTSSRLKSGAGAKGWSYVDCGHVTTTSVDLTLRTDKFHTIRYITGCAVAQHCCNDDQQSQWENGDFDPL